MTNIRPGHQYRGGLPISELDGSKKNSVSSIPMEILGKEVNTASPLKIHPHKHTKQRQKHLSDPRSVYELPS